MLSVERLQERLGDKERLLEMKRAETEQRKSLPGTARDKRGPDAEGKCVKDTEEETINSSDGVDHDLGTQNKLGRCCHTMRFFNINGAEMPHSR